MERPLKRQRLGAEDEGSSSTTRSPVPESLSKPISPPRKRVRESTIIKSPFQLTRIRDLSQEDNQDAITLRDLLEDPLIAECWEFNYLHDIHFLMRHFDQDTRDLVKVHIVHGFWKREDPNRLALQQDAETYKNVQLHVAPMPEMFGTHHSKMMILIRHDDTAQVIIHTANMIAKDWTNMTNAVWRSPLLPMLSTHDGPAGDSPIGSGARFKSDLLKYLRAYESHRVTLRPLFEELVKYDFSSIRAALVASVPGRHDAHDASPRPWGWPALKRVIRSIPVQEGKSEVVIQVSSIATLGATDGWIRKCLFDPLALSSNRPSTSPKPNFKVIFPTADEIRRSLDGYHSGGSIHTKIQSPQQRKQLLYLRPVFCHWANDSAHGKKLDEGTVVRESGRKRAAPHIKTYIRYGEKSIDWALVTSANISKQAWGEVVNGSQEVRIASWEIGVLIWPSLLAENATMVGTFKTDTPPKEASEDGNPVVGMRIPYNLPLQSYSQTEVPWVATMAYTEPDWNGNAWSGW